MAFPMVMNLHISTSISSTDLEGEYKHLKPSLTTQLAPYTRKTLDC